MADSNLDRFLSINEDDQKQSLYVCEGAYSGWVPRAIYSMKLNEVRLPFLRLLSFPVGGTTLGCLSSQLTVFDAVGNYLHKLPTSFAECGHLVQLDLGFNYFTEIPQPVYKLTKLKILNLEHNDLENIDSSIGQLKNLKVLDLNGNFLSEVPHELKRCRKLQRLCLSGKFYPRGRMTEFPECICYLTELKYLDLSWQQIRNIPSSFGNLRKLEELNVKWNQLQEVSSEIKRCIRLRTVDLSGALRLLSAIPEAVFSLEDLHSLNLSDNFFMDIPTEVCGLVKLRQLILQRNSLLLVSPDLFQLRFLEHLELCDNFLKDVPKGIKNLKRLQYLGLSNNQLNCLPDEICQLDHLMYLYVGNNKLKQLPEDIYRLDSLEILDVDNNELTDIPLLMDRLVRLANTDGLHILNNNLRSPFKEISEQGTKALFEFLKGIRLKEAHHRWKMIMIGAAKAGKTSLRQALMLGRSQLTLESERTWVMERHLWEPESRVRVQILDFGGHHIYQAAHHMFLSSDALHILVFDLTKYSTEVYQDLIGHWLEAIVDRAAGATIVIVGTHCDLCSKEDIEEKTSDIRRLMRRDDETKRQQIEMEIRRITEELDRPETRAVSGGIPEIGVGRMQEKLNRLQKLLNSRSKIPDRIHVVSCADKLDGLFEFRESLIHTLKSVPVTSLPDHWFTFMEQLQAVTDNVLTFDGAMELFQQVMQDTQQSMMGMRGSPERSLEMVLKYLHSTGEIVWYHDNAQLMSTVFHKPEALIDMLRAVFRHDFEEVVIYCQDIGDAVGLMESRFEKMKRDFLKQGLLTKELLKYLLIHFKLSNDASESLLALVLSVMLKFGLCFEFHNATANALLGSSLTVQFPWFFPEEVPLEFERLWQVRLPGNTFQLNMEIVFPSQSPPNFFEKLSVKLHDFLAETNRINWRDGVLAQQNLSRLLVTREKRNGGAVIAVMARGGSQLQELWSMIMNVRKAAMKLFKDWPLLKFEIYLVCMHCVLKGCEEPYRYPGHVLENAIPKGVYTMKCCDKFPDDLVPTSFVFPLEEASYQENHQEYMKAATDFMCSTLLDAVDGPSRGHLSVLSDLAMATIAANLGFIWTSVVLRLGLRQARIEQLHIDFNHDVFQQILHALLEWRDMDHGSEKEKVQMLFDVLESDDIGQNELVEKLKEKYSYS